MTLQTKHRRSPRSIFWRLCLRSLQVKRPQAALGIGSLIVGAAVCSLLLNLYGGVNRKMRDSFSAFGANVILAPAGASSGSDRLGALPGVMDELPPGSLRALRERTPGAASIPVLYVVTRLSTAEADPRLPAGEDVVAVGTNLHGLLQMNPNWRLNGERPSLGDRDCLVGTRLAAEMQFHRGDQLLLHTLDAGANPAKSAPQPFRIAAIVSTGDAADDQVFVPLQALQRFAGLPGKVSVMEWRLPGSASEIEADVKNLAAAFPETAVRPVRQIVYSEGKVLGTIRHLMIALTALILVIIALCVAATMTAIVLERRKDVAVMKALGARDRMVMELFLSEGAVLGLAGGVVGFFVGVLLARALALRLFDVALGPSWWVFPVVCLFSMILAVLATMLPVRAVRGIQPAVALKGA
ncbi:MAG: ABC transporter permease [Terriglobia bacterium]